MLKALTVANLAQEMRLGGVSKDCPAKIGQTQGISARL